MCEDDGKSQSALTLPTLPVPLEADQNVSEVLRDPGRVSSDGTSGTIASLAPAGTETEVFRNILLPCIRYAPTLPSRHPLYHTPQTSKLIG